MCFHKGKLSMEKVDPTVSEYYSTPNYVLYKHHATWENDKMFENQSLMMKQKFRETQNHRAYELPNAVINLFN